MNRRWKTLLAAAALALHATASAQVELKFASFPPPPGALNHDVLGPWVKDVNASLAGAAVVRLFPGGTLGRDPVQQFKLVRDRVADVAYVVMGYTPGEFPDSTIFELPFLIENSLEGSLAHWRMVERGLLRGYDKAKFLGAFTIPPQSLHTSFKLARIEDLKGQKIRSAGPYQSAAIELLGGAAVSGIPVSGAAEALSRGVVQGILSDWNGMIAFRIADAAKFHFEVPLGTAAAGVFMNQEAYNALPPAARAAIDKHSGIALSRLHGVEFDKRYRENFEKTRPQKEHTFVMPNAAEREAIRQRLQPITDKWIQETQDGRKRYDALVSILDEIRKGK
ncbi:MAG TPA: TRAP transporter substrate-binding protein [Burkholderiales bacterium]|jgi:TRAP-type C4-dicarboxylate transport system substrate-binding protein|nr:TRAP transporter substrate-binding protein [Burkholderiales bacterium]